MLLFIYVKHKINYLQINAGMYLCRKLVIESPYTKTKFLRNFQITKSQVLFCVIMSNKEFCVIMSDGLAQVELKNRDEEGSLLFSMSLQQRYLSAIDI